MSKQNVGEIGIDIEINFNIILTRRRPVDKRKLDDFKPSEEVIAMLTKEINNHIAKK